jgi:major membrane immunogen (membrane-anchored lipoprotein)
METSKTQAETTIQDGATFKIDGNWNEQAKALQKEFSQLSDADLEFQDGKEEELLKRVETRLSKSRKEVIELITKAQSAEKQN